MNKTKLTSLLTGLTIASLITVSAPAKVMAYGSSLYTKDITTPGNKSVLLNDFRITVGTFSKGACNDVRTRDFPMMVVSPGESSTASQDVIDGLTLVFGDSNYTCIKEDYYYDGKWSSTGFIHLIWSGHRYTGANPSQVSVNIG